MPRLKRLPSLIDATDWFYGFFPGLAMFAAFTSWGSLIVRLLRGEDAEEGWRTFVSSAALLASFSMTSDQGRVYIDVIRPE